MAARLAQVLGAMALLQALEHLSLASHFAQLGVTVGNLGLVVCQLARAGAALGLDMLDEGLTGVQLRGAHSGAGAYCQTLLGACVVEVCLYRAQVIEARRALRDGLGECQPGHVLAALAQGTDALQSETE